MAKIIKMNPQPNQEKNFEEFVNELPKEQQALIENFGIKSNEDMAAFATALGIDIEKMLDYYDKNPDIAAEDVNFDEFMMDEDHPFYHSSILSDVFDDDEEEPVYLPERVFIGETTTEYHIRMKLKDAPLPIWRELKVPSNITLETLSHIILLAMGWENVHLHQFKKGNVLYMDTLDLEEEEDFIAFSRYHHQDTNDWSLEQILLEKGDRMEYEYDFGDSWRHEIWVKGIREYAPNETPSIVLLKGKGDCPPEDCGGVWGYSNLLNIRDKKRKTKEEKEQLAWYDMNSSYFDPENYEIEAYQEALDDLWVDLTSE